MLVIPFTGTSVCISKKRNHVVKCDGGIVPNFRKWSL